MKTILINFSLIFALFLACSGPKTLTVKQEKIRTEEDIQKARDLYMKGVFLQLEDKHNEAITQFLQALLYDTTSTSIYTSIGESYFKLGQYESSLRILKFTLEREPENLQALRLAGENHFRLQDDSKAEFYFRKLLQLNPYDNEVRNFLVFLYEKNNNKEGSARQYEELLRVYGSDDELTRNLANLYAQMGKFDKADSCYRSLLTGSEEDAAVHYLRGTLFEMQDKTDSAIVSFRRSAEKNSAFPEARERLSMLLRSKEDWDGIINLFKKELKNKDVPLGAIILSAEAYYFSGRSDSARILLQPLTELQDAPPPGVFDILGRIEMDAGYFELALHYFDRLIDLDPQSRVGWIFKGFAYFSMDSMSQAEKTFSKSLDMFGDDPVLWSFLGLSQRNLKDNVRAEVSLRKALKLDPMNLNAISALPLIYEENKQFSRCDSLYEIAIQRFPDNAMLLNNYGYSLSERDIRLDEALHMAEKANTLSPENAAYLDTYGWIFFKLKDYKKAEDFIKKSLELRDDSSVVNEHLGDVYMALNRKDSARKYYQKALDHDPENQNARIKLEGIK